MDKQLEKPKGLRSLITKKTVPWIIFFIALLPLIILIIRFQGNSLNVNFDSLTIAETLYDDFNDYIRIQGRAQPMNTIQLSPREGGLVDKILVEEGGIVKAGEPILVLVNDNLDMQILNAEAELAEKENILRNTMIQMEQQKLSVRQDELQLSMEVQRNLRNYEQQKALWKDKLIPREDYLKAEEDYILAKSKFELVKERAVQDSLYRSVEIEQMRESLQNMRRNMEMIRRRKEKLVITAPIDGELGLLDVVLGQTITEGTKIGQINSIDTFKIETFIDELYIDRVKQGLGATIERNGETFNTSIRKIYPEVREGKFQVDFKFEGEEPYNIRSGQNYYLNLQLGMTNESIIIPRGYFYQNTGGQWIYVLNPDGTGATKRKIKIGRQNPQYYEVLDGLEPGERVIISSYQDFGDHDILNFR